MSTSTVERFFWSESPETQSLIAKYQQAADKAFEKITALKKEFGAKEVYRNGNAVVGFFFGSRAPDGWTKNKRGYHMPTRKTAEGKALYKRAQIQIPTEEDYFCKNTIFAKYWGVIHEGNKFAIPTAGIYADTGTGVQRVIIRCRMYKGQAPAKVEGEWSSSHAQYESDFVIPAGWNEWKEWEMLKWFDELRAKLAEKRSCAT